MAAFVDETELLQLGVGDFVAVLAHNALDGRAHWTLGSVETPPYLRDVEIRLWEKQKDTGYTEADLPNTEETGQLMARIAEVKGELQKSIDEADELTEQLRQRRASIVQQIGDVDDYVAESKAVMHAARDDVESIPDRHWNELKSYRVPPKMVSLVIRAVMLLLSEDEARTWPQMQRILRDFNFKSRITSYEPEQQLSPERREYILQECVSKKSFRYDRAMQGSAAVGPIYYWVLAQLDCGEANTQKKKVYKEKVARQKELRRVLKQLSEQQARISEYQALMDDLDDQLRLCHQHTASVEQSRSAVSVSRSRLRTQAAARYEGSFAGEQQKDYLRAAFYGWQPTDRVIIVLRKNVICNFGGVTKLERQEGYNMSEPQVQLLDDALLRRQAQYAGEDEAARLAREAAEEQQLEHDMFERNANEAGAGREDDEILKERELAKAKGQPTPAPSPRADDEGMRDNAATDALQRRFEGKSWQKVLERKRELILSTFTGETSECLEVPDYYVSVTDLAVGSLIVDFEVQHNGQRSNKELQDSVNTFGYPKMMALYEEEEEAIAAEEAAAAVPEHQMNFGGDRWADILPGNRDAVFDAFLTDTGSATSLPRDDIVVLDIRVEDGAGLTVDYCIRNSSLTAEEVQEMVDQFDYPCVWALYQRLAGFEDAGPLHQVRFRGERWEELLVHGEESIAKAFATDTSNALELPKSHIQTEEMRYERGLTVPYTVAGAGEMTEDDIDERVEEYKYPETWALYDRLVAEACGAHYQRAFEGVHWEAVLNEARPALTDAFRSDSASALAVPVHTVEACSLDTDQDRLLVSFNVLNDGVAPDEVRDNTKAYEYPETWALYGQTVQEQQDAVGNMKHSFAGGSWCVMVAEKSDAIEAAFVQDVREHMGIDAAHIQVNGVSADEFSMDVSFGVSRAGLLEYDVRRALEDCAFPNVWALYEELSESEIRRRGFGARAGESSVLERRFDGDDWDLLVDGAPNELRTAFANDAAKALGVSADRVRVVSAEVGSLVVNYQVVDPDYDDVEIARRIDECEFDELLGLYKSRIRARDEDLAANGAHRKRFEGDGWQTVVDEHRQDLVAAFIEDEAACLELAPSDIIVRSVKADEDGVTIGYDLQPARGADLASEEIQDKTNEYDFPAVWGVYDDRDFVTTSHQVGFDGDDWKYVLRDKQPELEEAFTVCTAELFGLSLRHILNARYTLGSLIVDFDLSHPKTLSEEDVNQQLNACPYEPVWELYGYHPYDPSEVVNTTHELGFEGTGWRSRITAVRVELERAFVQDTSRALEIEGSGVKIVELTYVEESLVAQLEITHSLLHDEEMIQEQLKQYTYDAVWALYEEDPEELFSTTSHQVGFDGEDWKYVLNSTPEALEKAFVTNTAEHMNVLDGMVTDVHFNTGKDSMLVDFSLKHPCDVSEEEVNTQLATCPYTGVWGLYGVHPYDPNERATTKHEVGFEGDQWASLLESQNEALTEAIVLDTAAALEVKPEDISEVELTVTDDVLVARMSIEHQVLQDEEVIQEQLSAYPYERVWALHDSALLGGGGGESGTLERRFDGEDWDILVDGAPEDVRDAFQRDVANALGVPADRVRVLSTEVGSLIVRYQIVDPPMDDAEIASRVNEHDFPELLGLYRSRLRGAGGEDGAAADGVEGKYAKSFEGKFWDDSLPENRPALNRAFAKDTSDALGVPAADVHVNTAKTDADGVRVTYELTGASAEAVDDAAVAEKTEAYAYPAVWALYGELSEYITTLHALSFEADGWELVVRRRRSELIRALADDVAEALGLAPEVLVAADFTPAPQSLGIGAKIKHRREVTVDDIDQALEACAFSRVWELYELLLPSQEMSKQFEGDGWAAIAEEHDDALRRAFAEDTARSVNVSRLEVEVQDVIPSEKGVEVNYVVRGSNMDELTMRQRAVDYPYPLMWALYEGSILTHRHFDGENWGGVVRDKREQLLEAFRADTADALAVPGEAVEVRQVRSDEDGLTVDYLIDTERAGPGAPMKPEVEMKVEQAAYPNTWELYQLTENERIAALGGVDHESGELERVFEGEDWDILLDGGCRGDVDEAFKKGVSDAVGVNANDVVVLGAHVGSLHVQYKVRGCPSSDEEISQRVEDHDFPELMDLYRRRVRAGEDGAGSAPHRKPALPAGWVESSHQVGFDGEDWPYVVKTKNTQLREAVCADVSAVLGTAPENVNDIAISADNQLLIDFTVQHPAALSETEVDEHLKRAKFDSVWALYGEHPYEPGEKITTTHDIGFEGEDWAYVLETKKDALEHAFKTGTANALIVPVSDVTDVTVEPTNDGIVMNCSVTHSPLQDEEMMQQQLKQYPYEEMWALYETRPYDPNTKIETVHQLDFEGDGWEKVCVLDGEEVTRALLEDTAVALELPAESVVKVEYTTSGSALAAVLTVSHSPLQDTDMIQEMLSRYEYPNVWALYDNSIESAVMHKDFVGNGWPGVEAEGQDAICRAFAKDTATMLNLSRHKVEVKSILTSVDDGLKVAYTVFGNVYAVEEIDSRAEDYAYPELWALYHVEEVPSTHALSFEGKGWQRVMDTNGSVVRDTFLKETAVACAVDPDKVEQLNFTTTETGTNATFVVVHPTYQTEQELNDRLQAAEYGRVWALYEEYDTTQHDCGFEGEDWDYVWETKQANVQSAFKAAVAALLNVQPSMVENVAMEKSADGIVLSSTITHHAEDSREAVDAKLTQCKFPEVWSLYETRPFDPNTLIESKHSLSFEGDAWGFVMERKGTKVTHAVRVDTAAALKVDPENVVDIAPVVEHGALEVVVTVKHSPLQDTDLIQEELSGYSYDTVWALYCPPNEAPVGTRFFEGEHWEALVSAAREKEDSDDNAAIQEAFASDTSNALSVEAEDVEVRGVRTNKAGLNIDYAVQFCQREAGDVQETMNNYPYPHVWALYHPITGARGLSAAQGEGHKKNFPGDKWEHLLLNRRDDLDAAFQEDTASALAVAANAVTITAVFTTPEDGMTVNYRVAELEGAVPAAEVDQKVEDAAYPRTWDLYDALAGAARPGKPATTVLSVSFDGEDWDYVLEKKASAVSNAFKAETAQALRVEPQDVSITEFVLGSLLVQFRVFHDGKRSDNALRELIDAYPYEKVWSLYEDRPTTATRALGANRAVTTHQVGFEAPNWEYVNELKHDIILSTFATAAAKACSCTPEDIQGAEVTVYPNMMKITTQVAHTASKTPDAVNEAMMAYDFEEIWELYEDAPEGPESKPMTKTFDGAEWAPLVQTSKNALSEAFRADTSRCLCIPRSNITVRDVRTGSLIIEYTVVLSGTLTEASVLRMTKDYAYQGVWELYKPQSGSALGGGERADGSSQRLFNGVNWDVVVARQRAELKTAFVEDTLAATGGAVTAEQVQLTSLYTTQGALVLNYRAEGDADQAALDDSVRNGDYAKVWALYRLVTEENYVTTEHGVGFDGEDWDYVLEKNRSALTDTFVMCTAELLGLQSRHIINTMLNVEPDNSGLSVTFLLKHPRSMTKSWVDKRLRDCPFHPVWQLYETRPYDPTRIVVSSHELFFVGEGWARVVDKEREALEEAFVADVREAMQMDAESENVTGVRVEKTETGILIGANMAHSPLQDHEMIQEELERHDFGRVWALFSDLPAVPVGAQASSTHQVGFEGDRWADVMAHRRLKVVNAVRVDTAAALQIAPEQVIDVTTEEQPDIMVCTVTVQYPKELTEDAVQEKISQFDYDGVWGLYDDTIAPRVDVLKNRSNSRMSGLMTKRFDGVDWAAALSAQPEKLTNAFLADTADVLQCSRNQIAISGMAIGSLVVQFRVRDLGMTEKKAAALTENYKYPNVWALYKSSGQAQGATGGAAAAPAPASTSSRQSSKQPSQRRAGRGAQSSGKIRESHREAEASRPSANSAQ